MLRLPIALEIRQFIQNSKQQSVRRRTMHSNTTKMSHYSVYPQTMNYEQNKTQIQCASSTFLLTNKDRFGCPIQAKKPLENKPPPGAYNVHSNTKRVKHALIYKKQAPTHTLKESSTTPMARPKAPGPAYYKPNLDPKVISHHLNIQNVWMS